MDTRRASPADGWRGRGAIPERDWQRVAWAEGTKGPLAARFAAVRVRPAKSRGERWLLCERSLADDERKYYLLNLDATATLPALVTRRAAGGPSSNSTES